MDRRRLTRRSLLGTVASAPLISVAGSSSGIGARAARAPNVLWVITDDQPRTSLPYMRSVMDRIVVPGQRFDHGYAAVPWCGPARASILTSRYAHNHGCHGLLSHEPFVAKGLDEDTVATRMHAAGYRTGYFGKYMNGHHITPDYTAPGWDRWVANTTGARPGTVFNVDGEIRTDVRNPDRFAARWCARFLEDGAARERPWFAVLAVTSPHSPYTPSAPHVHDFDGVGWDPVAFNERDMSDKPSWMRAIRRRDRERMRAEWQGKLEELQDTDDQVDALLTVLSGTGQLADTVVMMVSDNGYLLGEHRLFRKEKPYEESVGVPFVVHGPGISPGRPAALVSQVDLMPTTVAVAGLDPDAGRVLDGRNLLPHLTSGIWTGWRRRLLVENSHRGWALLCEGSVRFVHHHRAGERELYNLRVDPWQLRSRHASSDTSALEERLTAMRHATGLSLRALET